MFVTPEVNNLTIYTLGGGWQPPPPQVYIVRLFTSGVESDVAELPDIVYVLHIVYNIPMNTG
jgi:hypothetical protein